MTDLQQEEMLKRILASSERNGKSTPAIITAVLIAIAPTLAATAAWLKADSTHQLVNSRMSELLEITKQKASREGRQEGRDEQGSGRSDAALAAKIDELIRTLKQK